jgi:serine/threonine protein kinase
LVGSGSFGRTFSAIDEQIPPKPKCVIKQLYFTDTNREIIIKAVGLFHQEPARLDELKHSQISQLLAHFEQENQLYLVQELIVGQNLAQELRVQGVFGEAHIWQLLKDLLPVLQFIHSRQVIHQEIKLANIMRRYTSIVENEVVYPPPINNAALLHQASTMTIGKLESVSPFDLFDVTTDHWVWQNYLPTGNTVSDRLCTVVDKLLYNAL